MRIVSWNLNGMRAACRNGFVEWLGKDSPDVLCLQEIRAGQEQMPEELADDYHVFGFSAEKPGYAGTAVLSKEEPVKVVYGIGKKAFDDEGRIITVEYPEFTLVNLYAPHGGRMKEKMPHKMEFYSAFFDYIGKLKGNLILAGDYNIAHTELDLANPKGNENNTMFTPGERKLLDALEEKGFVDTFRKTNPNKRQYTWWPWMNNLRSRNVGWRIDYIFTRGINAKGGIYDKVKGSDHCPVGISLK